MRTNLHGRIFCDFPQFFCDFLPDFLLRRIFFRWPLSVNWHESWRG
jgi:hypothetical protein